MSSSLLSRPAPLGAGRLRLPRASGVVGVLLLLLAVALAHPQRALAHAVLEGTSPAEGAVAAHEPALVSFRFGENVEAEFGAVRVFDSAGRRVDAGGTFHPAGAGPIVGTALGSHLPDGTYTATYRVVSADGHIVTGGFAFSMGHPGASPALSIASLAGGGNGAVTPVASAAARAVQYGAIAVGAGALLFLFAIWLPVVRRLAGGGEEWRRHSLAFVSRARRVLLICAAAGAVSAVAQLALEAAEAGGMSGWSALAPHVLREEVGTRFGALWAAGAVCWMVLGLAAGLLLRPAGARAPVLRPATLGSTGLAMGGNDRLLTGALAAPAAVLVLLPSLSGHGATQSPVPLLLPAIGLHVASMSAWLGGLVCLLAVLPAATRELAPAGRAPLAAAVLERYSALALVVVGALLASGLLVAYVEVRHPTLFVTTGFGRAVLVKLALLAGLIALGHHNRARNVPAVRRAAQEGSAHAAVAACLRRTVRAEVALIVVALAVTGELAGEAPAIESHHLSEAMAMPGAAMAAHRGPFHAVLGTGNTRVRVTVAPARVGADRLHLRLIDARGGRSVDRALAVSASETLPAQGIGPLEQTATHTARGHFSVASMPLAVAGVWTVQVTLLVTKFDEQTLTVQVPIG